MRGRQHHFKQIIDRKTRELKTMTNSPMRSRQHHFKQLIVERKTTELKTMTHKNSTKIRLAIMEEQLLRGSSDAAKHHGSMRLSDDE
jgi:hypothetical protein